ncbi:MAG TPA: 50S ribosomal protein L30 [Burkholderiales bacterium]|jgi:large subunit ribosomal protein L30|nr:50S ribosomal protein L30 [Burkholderiales bacterium]
MAQKTIRVKLVKGLAGCKKTHRATVRGLGLKRLHQIVELQDTPEVRGMIGKVYYLVRVEG